ncbi:MAG TPA: fluoride efflux transporter CrcB [Anaerolineales bacterium]|nr:fluoride efflux transporter CrcB [Anaerolineales bacterium]
MDTFFLIGTGGFLGAILRYTLSSRVQNWTNITQFPIGTLVVNILGCLLIGTLAQLAETRDIFTPAARSLIFLGFLGAFTTFSTFSSDNFNLFQNGQSFLFYLNIGTNVILGLIAVWAGRNLTAYFIH